MSNPKQSDAEFDIHIRKIAQYLPEQPSQLSGNIPPNSTVNIFSLDDAFVDATPITLGCTSVPGGGPPPQPPSSLYFQLVATAATPPDLATAIQIVPGTSQTKTIRELGGTLLRFLNVRNPSPTVPGSYTVSFAANFARLGLFQNEMNGITGLLGEWDSAYRKATDPNAGSTDVANKNNVRTNFETFYSPLRRIIASSRTLTQTDRNALGIPERDAIPTPAAIPTTTPDTDLKPGAGNQVVIFFSEGSDEPGAAGRAKPPGVDRIEVRYKVGAPAPATPADCPAGSQFGRSPLRIDFTAAEAGMRLYLFFRWINTRNEPGPWTGTAQSIVIPG